MSLFDDLLKQTTPTPPPATQSAGQSGGNPPQDDPLISTPQIVISDATPIVSVLDIVQPPIEVPAGTPMNITESTDSIIIDESVSDTPMTPLITEHQNNISPIAIPDSPISDISSLFAMTGESPLVASVEDITTTTPEIDLSGVLAIPPIVQGAKKIFHDTNTYIDHAIEEVSGLIAGIDAQDAMVLTAEDEHRKQKEHFAELEIADEAAHQKHLEERAHAEKMKKYLEKEQGVVLKRNEEKEAVIA